MDEIMEQLVRAEQGQVRRAGRQSTAHVAFSSYQGETMAVTGAIIDYSGGAGARNLTLFLQLNLQRQLHGGWRSAEPGDIEQSQWAGYRGTFELPLSLAPSVYLEDIGGYYVRPKVTGSTLNAFLTTCASRGIRFPAPTVTARRRRRPSSLAIAKRHRVENVQEGSRGTAGCPTPRGRSRSG